MRRSPVVFGPKRALSLSRQHDLVQASSRQQCAQDFESAVGNESVIWRAVCQSGRRASMGGGGGRGVESQRWGDCDATGRVRAGNVEAGLSGQACDTRATAAATAATTTYLWPAERLRLMRSSREALDSKLVHRCKGAGCVCSRNFDSDVKPLESHVAMKLQRQRAVRRL
jgi:hypothetical protein